MERKPQRNRNGFEKNPQNINRTGANRKTVSAIIVQLKEKGIEIVTPKQVRELFESFLNCTKADLEEMMNDETQPMINRIVAKEMLSKKGFEIIERILNRAHGKPTERIEADISAEVPLKIIVSDQSTAESIEKLKKMIE